MLGTLRKVSLKVLAAVDMAGAARRLRLRPANLATVNNDIFASAKMSILLKGSKILSQVGVRIEMENDSEWCFFHGEMEKRIVPLKTSYLYCRLYYKLNCHARPSEYIRQNCQNINVPSLVLSCH